MRSRRDGTVLFHERDLRQRIATRLEAALRDVEALSEERLLGTPMEDLHDTALEFRTSF